MDIRGMKRSLRAALALFSAAILAACGGGETPTAGGAGGTAVGPVNGFGSVVVNGIRYATDNAVIVIGGVENRAESELKVGMRVRVDGAFSVPGDSGTAKRIEAIREVRGPMDDNAVDNVLNRLRVAGQTVLVDPATIFDNVADIQELQAIQSGALRHPDVEVHGAADDNGSIHATYIRKGADDFRLAEPVSVRGKMRNFNGVLRTFDIGIQAVTYPLLGLERVPPGAVFADGVPVDVRGNLSAVGGTGTLAATRIEVLDNAVGGNNDPVRIEGYVVTGTSKNAFTLLGPGGNVSVDGAAATLIPAGGAVFAGQKVQVEGAISGTVLKASVVRLRPPSNVRIEDTVPASPPPDPATGTLTVLFGKTVRTDGYTRFLDSAVGDRIFGLARLNPGDNVRIAGSFDGSAITATRIERITPADPGKVLLQGPVDNGSIVPGVSFRIAGVTVISFTTWANTEFRDASGNPVDLATFFGTVLPTLRPDQAVKVERGVLVPGTPPSIQDDDPGKKMEVGIEQVNN
jgi:uncharacterized protein YdeI (BOF family)